MMVIFSIEELDSLPGAAQRRLLAGLSDLQRVLALPSRLSSEDMKEDARLVHGLAEKCYFNAGWYAAAPEKPLPGSAATDGLAASIQIMADYLQSNVLPDEAKPAKTPKVGRPSKLHPFELINVLEIFNEARGEKTLWESVKECHAEGGLDKTVTIDKYYSRINRALDKFKERFGNVVPFPGGNKSTPK